MYESTFQTLVNLYCTVSVGGYVISDDFRLPMALKAVTDFRNIVGLRLHDLVPTDTIGTG
jgi:O-methyltransferase